MAKRSKPRKPYPSFPLTAHNNGQWCKKVLRKVHFFGVWAEPQAALDNHHRLAADLHAGRRSSYSDVRGNAIVVKGVCNYYLDSRVQKVRNGEILASTFDDCRIAARAPVGVI